MNITEYDCSVNAIQEVLNCMGSKLSLTHFVSRILTKHYDPKSQCLRLKARHPIEGLTSHGIETDKVTFNYSDMDKLESFISDAKGIVVQHSYASFLRGRGHAKYDFLRDVQHFFFCNELNIKQDNIIFKPIDPILTILTWKHLFYKEDDRITIYKIKASSVISHDPCIAINEMKKNIMAYNVEYAVSIDAQLISSVKRAAEKEDYQQLIAWMNAIRKLFITRFWFASFISEALPNVPITDLFVDMGNQYRELFGQYSDSVSNKDLSKISTHIELFESLLGRERELTSQLKDFI